MLAGYMFGLLPFMTVEADVFSMPWLTRSYEESILKDIEEDEDFSGRLQNKIMHWVIKTLNTKCDPLFDHLQKRGKFVNHWVVNDHDDLDKALETSCVRVIITDKPRGTIDYLLARNSGDKKD